MPGTARTRTKDTRQDVTGQYQNLGVTPPVIVSRTEKTGGEVVTCVDVVGNRIKKRKGSRRSSKSSGYLPNNFDLTRDVRIRGIVGGRNTSGKKILINFPVEHASDVVDPIFELPAPTDVQVRSKLTEAAAKSNPSASAVSLPTFVGELRELPSLVRSWGLSQFKQVQKRIARMKKRDAKSLDRLVRKYLKEAGFTGQVSDLVYKNAEGYLVWRWAIKPAISELSSMMNFMDIVDKRMQILERLKVTGSVKSRVHLKRESFASAFYPDTDVTLTSIMGYVLKARRHVQIDVREWSTLSWKLDSKTSIPGDSSDLRKQATRLVFGITSYETTFVTTWELMPWSWFVDWFAGVGTFIQAYNNTLGLTLGTQCYMRETKATASYTGLAPATLEPWVQILTMPAAQRVRKHRRVDIGISTPLVPSFSIPVLTGSQWSVLSALTVSKELKGFRGLFK